MKRAAVLLLLMIVPAVAAAGDRNLLWHVVQACVVSNKMLGASFPCLKVDLDGGAERGFAVIRAPFDGSHIVVTPTVRTIGIEAERLRKPDAPNYFAMAWGARDYATDDVAHAPERSDIALAVNSRPGRSQDQLHIHVDCVRQSVKRNIEAAVDGLRDGTWRQVTVLPRAPRYLATFVDEPRFASTNIFNLVRAGLHIAPEAMDDVTIVVVGVTVGEKPGFVVLARRRIPNSGDEAHGEALMDHGCTAFRGAAPPSNAHGHQHIEG